MAGKKKTTKLQDSVKRFTDFFLRIQYKPYREHFGSALGKQLHDNQQRAMFLGVPKSFILMLVGLGLFLYQVSKKADGALEFVGKLVLIIFALALLLIQGWHFFSAISHLRKSFGEADDLSAEKAREVLENEDELDELARAISRRSQTPPPPPSRDHPARRRGMSINYHFPGEDEDDAT